MYYIVGFVLFMLLNYVYKSLVVMSATISSGAVAANPTSAFPIFSGILLLYH
jgi:hypothetical protein